jgi:hypothetical protein
MTNPKANLQERVIYQGYSPGEYTVEGISFRYKKASGEIDSQTPYQPYQKEMKLLGNVQFIYHLQGESLHICCVPEELITPLR